MVKYRSNARAIRRGHLKPSFNEGTGLFILTRNTRNGGTTLYQVFNLNTYVHD